MLVELMGLLHVIQQIPDLKRVCNGHQFIEVSVKIILSSSKTVIKGIVLYNKEFSLILYLRQQGVYELIIIT
jgi:hypothetical protein